MRPPPPPPPPQLAIQFSSLNSISQSFTSNNSSNNLADIAARVVAEFRNDDDDIYNFIQDDNEPEINSTENHDDIYNFTDDVTHESEPNPTENLNLNKNDDVSESEDSDEEFEFAVDSIFFNGEILQRYPLFDRSLLLNDVVHKSDSKPVRQPLRKLFKLETETETASFSSSESDDLNGATPGTYCIWKPEIKSVTKKSNSTGSCSKRWRFRNLINRSNSDISVNAAKDASVIVVRHLTATKKRTEKVKKVEKTAKVEPVTVTDEVKSRNKSDKTVTEGNRIRSYLPYKPDLVGLSRNLHPF
ncbi:hypothetical protein HanPI659440_Chr08g0309231 [Helianthus annuus]|nr:hypothetical protein HanPI659440_Chr08g0309231 [Helianthus annuus]